MAKKNVITAALILIGIVIVAFFGIRAFHAFKHFQGHGPFRGPPQTKSMCLLFAIG